MSISKFIAEKMQAFDSKTCEKINVPLEIDGKNIRQNVCQWIRLHKKGQFKTKELAGGEICIYRYRKENDQYLQLRADVEAVKENGKISVSGEHINYLTAYGRKKGKTFKRIKSVVKDGFTTVTYVCETHIPHNKKRKEFC